MFETVKVRVKVKAKEKGKVKDKARVKVKGKVKAKYVRAMALNNHHVMRADKKLNAEKLSSSCRKWLIQVMLNILKSIKC